MIKVYSTGCPRCKVLEAKLQQKGIDYSIENDQDAMKEKGILSVPYLEVDDELLEFGQAIKWVNNRG